MRVLLAMLLRNASRPAGIVRRTHTSSTASMIAPPVSAVRSLLRPRLARTSPAYFTAGPSLPPHPRTPGSPPARAPPPRPRAARPCRGDTRRRRSAVPSGRASPRQLVLREIVQPLSRDDHVALTRPVDAGDEVQERRFPRSRGPHEAHEMSRRDVERHALERVHLIDAAHVATRDIADLDEQCAGGRVHRRDANAGTGSMRWARVSAGPDAGCQARRRTGLTGRRSRCPVT